MFQNYWAFFSHENFSRICSKIFFFKREQEHLGHLWGSLADFEYIQREARLGFARKSEGIVCHGLRQSPGRDSKTFTNSGLFI